MSHPYSYILGRPIDPGEELSNLDLVKIMTNDRHSEIKELRKEIKEIMDEDRNHTKCMIKLAVEGLCRRLDTLEKHVITQSSDITNKLADLALKQETVSLYQEQLIDSMNCRIHDIIMKRPETSMTFHVSGEFYCAQCELTFNSKSELCRHQDRYHVSGNPCLGPSCGDNFSTRHDLVDHTPGCTPLATHEPPTWHAFETYSEPQHPSTTVQSLTNIHPCTICEITFLTCCDLAYHIEASHNMYSYHQCGNSAVNIIYDIPDQSPLSQTQIVHCKFCNYTFHNMRQLNLHVKENHVCVRECEMIDNQTKPSRLSLTCDLCGKAFTSGDELESHINLKHSSQEHPLLIPQFDGHVSLTTDESITPASSSDTVAYTYACQTQSARLVTNATMSPMSLHDTEDKSVTEVDVVEINEHEQELQDQNMSYCSDNLKENLHSHQINKEGNRPTPITILQVDGNCTLLSDSCSTPTEEVRDVLPLTSSTPSHSSCMNNQSEPVQLGMSRDITGSVNESLQLQYTLNPGNQAKRLYENTDRPNLDIRYNNPQTILGKKHPTNVTIECNSGVYLAAIKPGLLAITKGWQTQISQTLISCEDLTPRKDMSGRLVCTKLVLYLTESTSPTNRCKAVLHFYHTSCTVQVQGSSLLSCGTCAPVWLTKYFLEPLAITHTSQNKDEIETINANIRQSASAISTCSHCNNQLNPTAFHPKDQELSCSKCSALFHKKCTDRKKSTGNWKKSPWFCQSCIMGTQDQRPIQPLDQATHPSQPINPPSDKDNHHPYQNQGPPHQSVETPLARFLSLNSENTEPDILSEGIHTPLQQVSRVGISQAQSQDTQPQPGQPRAISTAGHPLHPQLCCSQPTSLPDLQREPQSLSPTHSSASSRPSTQTTTSSSQVSCSSSMTTFPTTATRQRSSNITIHNPEYEFQQTALSACRSTITQQEAELKTLKESLNLRNKRILQLESQVGVAAESIAARDCSKDSSDTIQTILNRIEGIENNISSIKLTSNNPPNNIVINNCRSDHSNLKQYQSVTTQTSWSDCDCACPRLSEPCSMSHQADSEECPGMTAPDASMAEGINLAPNGVIAAGEGDNPPTQGL